MNFIPSKVESEALDEEWEATARSEVLQKHPLD